jgi:hypothetical protein
VGVLLATAVVGGAVAFEQRRVAQREERAAALTALTSNAAALRTNRRDLAALLAVEAYRMAPSAATESALFGTFTAAPGLSRIVHTDIDLAQLRAETQAWRGCVEAGESFPESLDVLPKVRILPADR